MSNIIGLFLLCCLFTANSFSLTPEKKDIAPITEIAVKEITDNVCAAKLNDYHDNAFENAPDFGRLTQIYLRNIYKNDPRYPSTNIQPQGQALNDGIYGPVTQHWLAYFCTEFSVDTTLDYTIFIDQLFSSLEIIAELTNTYPEWRKTIAEQTFKDWFSQENIIIDKIACHTDSAFYGCPSFLHALLDEYFLYLYRSKLIFSGNNSSSLMETKENTNDEELNSEAVQAGDTHYNLAESDCGCAIKVSDEIIDNTTVRNFYGFYAQTSKVKKIDFSQLTRIGYLPAISLAAIKHEKGNEFVTSEHFNNYLPFVIEAHQHRVAVDIVISSAQIVMFNDNERQQLIESIYKSLKFSIREKSDIRLQDKIIDILKPILSFGTSPSRKIAEGITLDLDLKQAHHLTNKQAFIDFIQQLKEKITPPSATSKPNEPLANITDEYYLNIMVPVSQLLCEKDVGTEKTCAGFYSVENLLKLSAYVNLFIVTANTDSTDKDIKKKMKELRATLAKHENEVAIKQLFEKIVPTFTNVGTLKKESNGNDEQIKREQEKRLNYIDWNYNGLAYLPLPDDKAAYQNNLNTDRLKKDIGFSPCKYICSNRWLVRTGLFILFVMVALYVVLSFWLFQLKKIFHSTYFMAIIAAALLIVMSALYCDPFWMKHQGNLFAIAMLIALLMFAVVRMKKNRTKLFP